MEREKTNMYSNQISMKHECVSAGKFSNNYVSKNLSWKVERLCNRKCFNCFWKAFHVFIALYITAYDFMLKDFTLNMPFPELDVSYLCVSDGKKNNYWKFQATDCLKIYWQISNFQ